MEQPLSLSAEHIRIEKVKLLQSIQPLALDNLLVGQYTENSKNPGYLGERDTRCSLLAARCSLLAALHVP